MNARNQMVEMFNLGRQMAESANKKSEHELLTEAFSRLLSDSVYLLKRIEALPSTDVGFRTAEILGDAVISIEDAKSAFEDYFWPEAA